MANAPFDTLKFANALKAAGVPDRQAEAEAAILAEVLSINFKELISKDDLRQAAIEVEGKLREAEQRLNFKVDQLRSDLNAKIDALGAKNSGEFLLVKWMMGVVLSLAVAIAVRLFFFKLG